MTTKIDGSSSAVVVPSHDDADAPPPAAASSTSTESNQLSSWSSPAADEAVSNIESSYGFGITPDMESIDSELGKLDGFALLKTLNKLDADDKLESILNRMSPNERQQVINQAVKGNLLERDRDDKLKAKFELPDSFKKMVDELNTLTSREKPKAAFTYNWSAYQEDAHDVAKRKFADQISTLKPGDSIQLEAKLGASAHHVTGTAESNVEVKRGLDGKFTLSAEVALEGGAEAKAGGFQFEGLLGAGGRVEYKFATAEEAKAAAELFATSPPEALEKFGKPAAIQLEGKVAAEAARSFGLDFMKGARAKGSEGASFALRVELDKPEPTIALIAKAELQGKVAAEARVGPASAQLHGLDAHADGSITVELRTKLRDPDAFLAAPSEYLKQRTANLMADASAKVVYSEERTIGHHSTVSEMKLTTSAAEVQRFAWKANPSMSKWELLAKASEGTQLEMRERKFELKHYGADLRLEVGEHADISAGAGYERKSVESDTSLYKGTVKDFVTGRR